MKGPTVMPLEFPRIPNTTVVDDDRVVIAESGITSEVVTPPVDTTPAPEVTA